MKMSYRVANIDTKQGLWYNQEGEFTGLIHNSLDFCKNSTLQMPFDEILSGWLSATETMNELFTWFPIDDIVKLQDFGYAVMQYEAEDFDFYIKNGHWVINQSTSKLVNVFKISLPINDLA